MAAPVFTCTVTNYNTTEHDRLAMLSRLNDTLIHSGLGFILSIDHVQTLRNYATDPSTTRKITVDASMLTIGCLVTEEHYADSFTRDLFAHFVFREVEGVTCNYRATVETPLGNEDTAGPPGVPRFTWLSRHHAALMASSACNPSLTADMAILYGKSSLAFVTGAQARLQSALRKGEGPSSKYCLLLSELCDTVDSGLRAALSMCPDCKRLSPTHEGHSHSHGHSHHTATATEEPTPSLVTLCLEDSAQQPEAQPQSAPQPQSPPAVPPVSQKLLRSRAKRIARARTVPPIGMRTPLMPGDPTGVYRRLSFE